jgi:hypothetical protein
MPSGDVRFAIVRGKPTRNAKRLAASVVIVVYWATLL